MNAEDILYMLSLKIWGGGGMPPWSLHLFHKCNVGEKERGGGVYSTVEPLMWTLVGQKKVS